MPEEKLRYLLERYFSKICTEEEQRELSHLILQAKDDKRLKELLEEIWSNFTPSGTMPQEKSNLIINSILKKDSSYKIQFGAKTRRIWWRVTAAAIIVLMLSAGSYFIYFNHNSNKHQIAKVSVHDVSAPNAIKAKLTLGDGRTIYLDSALSGSVAIQGNVKVTKSADGQISYNGTNDKIIYNTLSNPRGSRVIDLMLSDGSKVWLNAGSTLKYPIAFIGTKRKVEITGEAYFEVTKNPDMPFYVTHKDVNVKVLGTHFNVNTYEDEKEIKITLLEGSVYVSKGNENSILKPGQQAVVNNSPSETGGIKVANDVNVEEVMAWKNGRFYFDGADIKTIMRQIEKWYNVEVEFQSDIRYSFVANISRTKNVSELLKILQLTDLVHFEIKGNKIIVMK